jgi:hypothetical protein
LIASLALLLLAAGGCSSDSAAGPLGEPRAEDTPDRRCFATDDGTLTKHVTTITATEELRITGVDLVGADNVEVLDGFALPFAGNAEVTGTFLRYPPGSGNIADSLMQWSARVPAEDFRFTSGSAPQALLVGLGLTDPGADGRFAGFRLEYADGDGTEFSREYPAPTTMKRAGVACMVDDFD